MSTFADLSDEGGLTSEERELLQETNVFMNEHDEEAEGESRARPALSIFAMIALLLKFSDTRTRFSKMYPKLYTKIVQRDMLRIPEAELSLVVSYTGLKPGETTISEDTVNAPGFAVAQSTSFAKNFLEKYEVLMADITRLFRSALEARAGMEGEASSSDLSPNAQTLQRKYEDYQDSFPELQANIDKIRSSLQLFEYYLDVPRQQQFSVGSQSDKGESSFDIIVSSYRPQEFRDLLSRLNIDNVTPVDAHYRESLLQSVPAFFTDDENPISDQNLLDYWQLRLRMYYQYPYAPALRELSPSFRAYVFTNWKKTPAYVPPSTPAEVQAEISQVRKQISSKKSQITKLSKKTTKTKAEEKTLDTSKKELDALTTQLTTLQAHLQQLSGGMAGGADDESDEMEYTSAEEEAEGAEEEEAGGAEEEEEEEEAEEQEAGEGLAAEDKKLRLFFNSQKLQAKQAEDALKNLYIMFQDTYNERILLQRTFGKPTTLTAAQNWFQDMVVTRNRPLVAVNKILEYALLFIARQPVSVVLRMPPTAEVYRNALQTRFLEQQRPKLVRALYELVEIEGCDGQPLQSDSRVSLENKLSAIITDVANTPETYTTSHLNFILMGGAGAGKTRYAQIIASVLKNCGILLSPLPVDVVSRPDLVGQYLGQSAPRTKARLFRNLENVMFIDEAYALAQQNIVNGRAEWDSYSKEVMDEIVNFLDKYKGKICVIAAGYPQPIQELFLKINEGMKRRFPFILNLPNYSNEELIALFCYFLSKNVGVKPHPQYGFMSNKASCVLRAVVDVFGAALLPKSAGDMENLGQIAGRMLQDKRSVAKLKGTSNDYRTQILSSREMLTAFIKYAKDAQNKLLGFSPAALQAMLPTPVDLEKTQVSSCIAELKPLIQPKQPEEEEEEESVEEEEPEPAAPSELRTLFQQQFQMQQEQQKQFYDALMAQQQQQQVQTQALTHALQQPRRQQVDPQIASLQEQIEALQEQLSANLQKQQAGGKAAKRPRYGYPLQPSMLSDSE